MKNVKLILTMIAFPVLMFAGLSSAQEQKMLPIDVHGELRVEGNQIVGESGEPAQLMGMSLYWSIWGGERFYNRDVVTWLVEDWNIDLIRASMGVEEGAQGYIHDKEEQTKMVDSVITAAVDNGIYVIVDWHTHEIHLEEAKEVFNKWMQSCS
ncbi:MAG: cellulase family glycosylhydrolase [Desulfosalsimonas sp.]